MSVHVESWAWKQQVGGPLRKLILVKLAQNADDDGWSWWGQKNMAKECETTRSTLQAHLKALRGAGVVQVHEQVRGDGGRTSNFYRVMVPWAVASDPPPDSRAGPLPAQVGQSPARQAGTMNHKSESSELPISPPTPPPPQLLGERRFRVASNSTAGKTYVADLARSRCSCQAGKGCRHLEAARAEEERLQTARGERARNVVWDTLAELFGPATTSGRGDRGKLVVEVAELLAMESVAKDKWGDEIRGRHATLAREWGAGKVTIRAFVANFGLAGKLVRGERPKPTASGRDLTIYDT